MLAYDQQRENDRLKRASVQAASKDPQATVASSSSCERPPVKRRRLSLEGALYSPLVLVKAVPVPAKFCVTANVASWFPMDLERFVVCKPSVERGAEVTDDGEAAGEAKLVFLFALRVCDDTAELDLIFTDKDAELFLGTTTKEFRTQELVRQRVLQRLLHVKNHRVPLDFYVMSYAPDLDADTDSNPDHGQTRNQEQPRGHLVRFRCFKARLFPYA